MGRSKKDLAAEIDAALAAIPSGPLSASLSDELIDSATNPSPSATANANWDFYCRTDYLRTVAHLIESLNPVTDQNLAKERLELMRAAMAKAKEML